MAAKSSATLITRLVLIGVLITGLVLLVVDRKARSAAQDFKRELDSMLPELTEGDTDIGPQEPTSARRVQELAGREPAKSYEHEKAIKTHVEEYHWRGAFRSFTVYCYYKTGADKLLDAVSLNAPLPDTSL